jgi:hypothetical protein
VLLKRAAHYLIYGSEWVSAVLGAAGRRVLLQRGAPTLLEIDLPLRMSSVQTRTELATKMLRNGRDWRATGLTGPRLSISLLPANRHSCSVDRLPLSSRGTSRSARAGADIPFSRSDMRALRISVLTRRKLLARVSTPA